MKGIKKILIYVCCVVTAATAGVAVGNAAVAKPDEEVGHIQGVYEKYIKRPMDFSLASCALLTLSPVMLCIAILVREKLGSPVFFTQDRPGRNENIFRMYKFRTMTDERDASGELLPDELRLTRFGKILRSTSLDELPELINIIKGDMAVVGPRPLLLRYLGYYTDNERKRHSVRPGLTGLSQINGRNNLTWEKRFELDVNYSENISFSRDVAIVFKTVLKVLWHSDIAMGNEMILEDLDVERKTDDCKDY